MGPEHCFLHTYLKEFRLPGSDGQLTLTGGAETICDMISVNGGEYPRFTNEFWTARQRQASRLHEISYRACFKPQLPRFFISLLTNQGEIVYDPFAGRGTTPIEAALLGRRVLANDINPLSKILTMPRLSPPSVEEVKARLMSIPDTDVENTLDLSMFYHSETLRTICSLREYLIERERDGTADPIDLWIRMVATNRLTGHSPGFFSVYTLPPNQAVTQKRQVMINEKRNQTPLYRDVRQIILKKTGSLLQGLTSRERENLTAASQTACFLTADAGETQDIPNESVSLTVTSPPFLDIVQYSTDNWLRCWFNGLDADKIGRGITMARKLPVWEETMQRVFHELYRITKPRGWVAFEVGEVRNGSVKLDEQVIPLGITAGFSCSAVVINQQDFTKTANIWGVENMSVGTNTNRIVVFQKL